MPYTPVGVGLIVTAALAIVGALNWHKAIVTELNPQLKEARRTHQTSPPSQLHQNISSYNGQLSARRYKPDCRKKEYATLCAQMRMAKAAENQTFYTKFGLGVLIFTFVAAFWAALEARRAAKAGVDTVSVAERTLAATERPWLSVEIEELELTIKGDRCNFSLTYKIRNVGRAPATSIYAWPSSTSDHRIAMRRALDFQTGLWNRKGAIGFSLFPNDSSLEPHTDVITRRELNQPNPENGISLYIVIAIEYRSPVQNTQHITTIVRQVWMWDPSTEMNACAICWEDKAFHASDLMIVKEYSGNRAT